MGSALARIVNSFDAGERRRLGLFMGAVVLLHLIGWGVLLLLIAPRYPLMLGLGGLAYTFGLRHAFDADHISAIDNTTRKLLAAGKRPVGVGFFFSLGHSSVVFLISLALGLAVKAIYQGVVSDGGALRNIGGLIGTSVSGTFLLIIGLMNLAVLVDVVRLYRHVRNGHTEGAITEHLTAGGPMTRVFGRIFRIAGESWHMYPIGFLFGLGFDTASEVALLAVSATVAAKGLPIIAVLSLPVIFAAGMSMMDTIDGAFMAKAYGWAFSNPIRKIYYNMTVTGLSVFVALFVGTVEVLQVISGQLMLNGAVWTFIDHLNFNILGFIIVGAFVVTWAGALAWFKLRRIEERWNSLMEMDHVGDGRPAA